jgi:hypothetical protein
MNLMPMRLAPAIEARPSETVAAQKFCSEYQGDQLRGFSQAYLS